MRITLTRKSRYLPGLKEQVGSGELTIWQVDKTHGNAIVSKQTHTSPVGSLASAGFPVGYQFTDSENHTEWTHSSKPTFDRELKTLYETVYSGVQGSFGKGSTPDKPEYDVGGDFFTQKLTVQVVNPSEQVITGIGYDTQYSNWSAKYRGPILCGALSDMAVPPIVLGNLNTVGATAIARCSPTNNIASAANFLHELRQEGMPKLFGLSLLKERARFFRGLGEEYLNKEFGWDPLIGDVKAIAFAITHAHEVLQQYERDSGKVVRRRYEFPEEITESTTTMRASDAFLGNYATGVFNPVNPGGDPLEILREGGSTGTLFRRRQTRRKVWFSGAFTYHLPWGYNSRIGMIESARHAQTLLGLDITPEILWNAAPWTWAIDWFSNAGDVVANLSDWATDGLVMKYGYVMEHQIVTDTYYVDKLGRLQKSTKAQPSPVIVSLETKRRVKASPFGFGITWSGLSPRQIAISVALGLTRGIRH